MGLRKGRMLRPCMCTARGQAAGLSLLLEGFIPCWVFGFWALQCCAMCPSQPYKSFDVQSPTGTQSVPQILPCRTHSALQEGLCCRGSGSAVCSALLQVKPIWLPCSQLTVMPAWLCSAAQTSEPFKSTSCIWLLPHRSVGWECGWALLKSSVFMCAFF